MVAAAHLTAFLPTAAPGGTQVGGTQVGVLDVQALFAEAKALTSPARTFTAQVAGMLTTPMPEPTDTPVPSLQFTPRFDTPMVRALTELGQQWLLPGLDGVPANTAVALRTNGAFVESFLVGLNHEFGRELLWREFPTPLTATFFERFWDAAVAPDAPPDIPLLDTWADRALGAPTIVEERFVLLLRSELLRRFPDALVSAVRAGPPPEHLMPVFRGALEPDITFFGFTVPLADADEFSIVIAEQPGAPRFGFEVGEAPAGVSHAPAAGATSAQVAAHLRQLPATDHDPGLRPAAEAGAMTGPLDLAPLTADALASDPRLAGELVASDHPLALLPVRLETRYRTDADGTSLLVRIYPDQVHVDAHDPRLSAAEIAAGQEFWRAQWRTGRQQRPPAARVEDARRPVRARPCRLDRARHRADEPAGATRLPSSPTAPSCRPSRSSPTSNPPSSAAPRSHACCPASGRRPPTRRAPIVAVGTGRPITIDPAVGPDLAAPLVQQDDDDEVAAIDAGMNWLVDFEDAEELGMALRLPVSGPVDLLLVTGVREFRCRRRGEGADRPAGRPAVQRGPGVPQPRGAGRTTPKAARPAGRAPPPGRGARARRRRSPGPRPPVLRPPSVSRNDIFAPLPAADATEDALAAAMSTVVWPASWGYWLQQFAGIGPRGHRLGRRACAQLRPPGRAAADAARRPPTVRAPAGDLAGPLRRRRAAEPAAPHPRRPGGRGLASRARAGATGGTR